jgi:uncharacterized protein
MPCPQLTIDMRCAIFGKPERPEVCASLKRLTEMCGDSVERAFTYLERLEKMTTPE